MSETQQEYPLGTFDLRETQSDVILPPARTGTRHLHLPAEEIGNDILCGSCTRKQYHRKDIDCLPDGHVNWCRNCLQAAGVIRP